MALYFFIYAYSYIRCCLSSTGCSINVEKSPKIYPNDVIIERALDRLGENKYKVIINNCEHFVRWCRGGI